MDDDEGCTLEELKDALDKLAADGLIVFAGGRYFATKAFYEEIGGEAPKVH